MLLSDSGSAGSAPHLHTPGGLVREIKPGEAHEMSFQAPHADGATLLQLGICRRQDQNRIHFLPLRFRRRARCGHPRRLSVGAHEQQQQTGRAAGRAERARRPDESRHRAPGQRAPDQARSCRCHDRHGVLQRIAAPAAGHSGKRYRLHLNQYRAGRLCPGKMQQELLRHLLAERGFAGRESIAGLKRHYKGKIADEVYVKLGQLDFSAELAQARVSKADSVFFFLPGAMGSAFLKQMDSGGLNKTMRIYAPGFSGDQDSIKAVGEPMLGMYNASQWASDLDNAENAKFVREFEKQYGRIPTMYAAQGYDAALLLDGAVRDVKGHIEDKTAFPKARRAANFKSVRGDFKFNKNHYPIHNIHMRVVERDKQGRISNRTVGMIAKDYSDPYAANCKMD